MKINGMINFINRIANNKIEVNQSRCVLVRNRNADCLRCAEACVSGCIHYEENELVISPLACIGCGTCCTVCPTAALTAKNPDDEQLLLFCERAAAANDGVVTVICDRVMERAGSAVDATKVVVVPCIGRMEESIYATLAADDVKRIVAVDMLCEGCEYAAGRAAAETVCETTRTLFDTWHSDCKLALACKLPASVRKGAQAYDRDRRALFTAVKDTSVAISLDAAEVYVENKLGSEASLTNDSASTAFRPGGQPSSTTDEGAAPEANENLDKYVAVGSERQGPTYIKVNEQGVLPHFVPDRRERLIDALRRLGEPDDIMFNTRLWGNVIVDPDKCRSCYMCATFCPTGAMRKLIDEDGVAHGVGHYPSSCVKCHSCENICMAHAITISEEVFATDMLAGMTEEIRMRAQGPDVGEEFGLGKGNFRGV